MNDWVQIDAVKQTMELGYLMWDKNWDEANAGNISYILSDEEASALDYIPGTGRRIDLKIPDALRGKYIMVTATGSYFRELRDNPEHLIGITYIPESGNYYEIAAGLVDNRPSSEFPAHLGAHAARLAVDPDHRIVMHNHATNLLTMTHCGPADEKEFTKALWRMIPECINVIPEGVGFIPYMTCGTQEIGDATNEKMKDHKFIIWQWHGVFSAGRSLHDAFGVLETVEKVAGVWINASIAGRTSEGISDRELQKLLDLWGMTCHESYLDV